MRYIAYALPLVLSLGVIAAGLAARRAAAGKVAVVCGVAALAVSALAVWQVELAIGRFEAAVERLGGGLEGLGGAGESVRERCLSEAGPPDVLRCLADPESFGIEP
jgi:hypothetical protein